MINRANIILTHNCNLRCKHCYIDAKYCNEDKNKVFNETKKLLDKLLSEGINNVMFTGGECMIFPYIKELVAYAKKIGMSVTIFTNGMIFDKEIFDMVDHINLSLDGPRDVHNYIRQNQNSYDNIIKVLNYLKKIDKKTTLQMTINNHNIDYINFLGDFTLRYLNIRDVKLVFVSNIGRAKDNNIYHKDEFIDKVLNSIEEIYEKSKYHIQFNTNIIKKYDFKNYYLSGDLSFALWFDIPNNKYYVLSEELNKKANNINDFSLTKANQINSNIIKLLSNSKEKISENKYINIEDTILKLIKGDF